MKKRFYLKLILRSTSKGTYNKDWRESDPEEEKYLCEYDGDYEFKLRIDTDGNINLLDNYHGNYDFQFEPKNVKDIEVLKTKVTHPDVEYVYSEDGIKIYSDIIKWNQFY